MRIIHTVKRPTQNISVELAPASRAGGEKKLSEAWESLSGKWKRTDGLEGFRSSHSTLGQESLDHMTKGSHVMSTQGYSKRQFAPKSDLKLIGEIQMIKRKDCLCQKLLFWEQGLQV